MDVSVAISTTGHEHRMELLRWCVGGWDAALDTGDRLFVTVDGTEEDALRVREVVKPWTSSVWRVGQRRMLVEGRRAGKTYAREQAKAHGFRLGVAVNKNTGLESMMDNTRATRLWLSDDDSWPLSPASLVAHYSLDIPHSMVCWGNARRDRRGPATHGRRVASWFWPRGSVLYVERKVVDAVGGMVEQFGWGGHEHVEWSNRIHSAGFTPCNYPTPVGYCGDLYMGARRLWHCEDMSQPGEPLASLISRRRHLTTIDRESADQALQNRIMHEMEGSSDYIPYHAERNGRVRATLLPIA